MKLKSVWSGLGYSLSIYGNYEEYLDKKFQYYLSKRNFIHVKAGFFS
jgi:hypothetical protein